MSLIIMKLVSALDGKPLVPDTVMTIPGRGDMQFRIVSLDYPYCSTENAPLPDPDKIENITMCATEGRSKWFTISAKRLGAWWVADLRAKTYVFSHITDLLKVPDEDLPRCLTELAGVLKALRPWIKADVRTMPNTLSWVDDNTPSFTVRHTDPETGAVRQAGPIDPGLLEKIAPQGS
jgi:hypothetical protein